MGVWKVGELVSMRETPIHSVLEVLRRQKQSKALADMIKLMLLR